MIFYIKTFFLFLISFNLIFHTILYSQTKLQDSLQKLLNLAKSDTAKFNLLLKISTLSTNNYSLETSNKALVIAKKNKNKRLEAIALNSFIPIYIESRDFSKAFLYANKANNLFGLLHDSVNIANCYYDIGRIQYYVEKTDSSLFYHHLALKIREKLKDSLNIATSLNAIGLMNWRIGNFDEAEIYFLKSIKMRNKKTDLVGISITYNNLGSLHWGLSNFNKALSYFLQALEIAEKNKDFERVILINNNIGLIYQEWGDFDKALVYHQKAKLDSEKTNYYFGLAYSYINLGNCYKHFKNYSIAIENFNKALANYEHENKSIGIALSYRHLSETYLLLKEYTKAINSAKLSLINAEKVNSEHHISNAHKVLAQIYLTTKKYKQAKEKAFKSLEIAQKYNYKEIIKESTFILSEVFYVEKQYHKSLTYFKISTSISDSIFNDVKSKQIAEMQAKYETEKQKQEIELQKIEIEKKNAEINEKENMQKALSIGLFSSLIIFLLIIYSYLKIKKAKNKINIQKEELQIANQKLVELSKFKETLTGMIVHDLKNPLNIINNISNIPEIKEPASKMYTLVMNILDIQKFESSKMNIFIEQVDLYSIIEVAYKQVLFIINRKNINFQNLISKQLIVFADKEKLERVLVNLLNNAAKYTPNNGNIFVKMNSIDETKLKLLVIDSGEGIPKSFHKDIFAKFGQYQTKSNHISGSTGLGLTFCQMAMNAINQEIGIDSEEGKGSTFWITLEKVNTDVFFRENTGN